MDLGFFFSRFLSLLSKPIYRHYVALPSPRVLWNQLELESDKRLSSVELLSCEEVRGRFRDIRCPKKTAILTTPEGFLHANKVGEGITERALIVSQYPLDEDFDKFWKAVFDREPVLFDLTTANDQRYRGLIKYYPDALHEAIKYGSISVELTEVGDNIRTYTVSHEQDGSASKTTTIKRYHYDNWPDHGVISLSELTKLIKKIEELAPHPENLAWIHCTAGVGRSGTIITGLILKEKITSGEINKANLASSLEEIIINFRSQRGRYWVQTQEQFELLLQYADSLIEQA